jgi:hypothetical protein
MQASAMISAEASWKIGTIYQYSNLPVSTSMLGMLNSECPIVGRKGPDLDSVIAIVLKSMPVRESKLGIAAKAACTRLIQIARS